MEVLRYLYRLPWMEGRFRIIFSTRVLQLFGMPLVLVFLLFNGLTLLESGQWLVVGDAALAMLISLAATRQVLGRMPLTARQYSPIIVAKVFLLTNLILLVVAFGFPFHKQSSQYARLASHRPSPEEPVLIDVTPLQREKADERVGAIPI
jgi:hypothetical protein